jgi:hypothetical protein
MELGTHIVVTPRKSGAGGREPVDRFEGAIISTPRATVKPASAFGFGAAGSFAFGYGEASAP